MKGVESRSPGLKTVVPAVCWATCRCCRTRLDMAPQQLARTCYAVSVLKLELQQLSMSCQRAGKSTS